MRRQHLLLRDASTSNARLFPFSHGGLNPHEFHRPASYASPEHASERRSRRIQQSYCNQLMRLFCDEGCGAWHHAWMIQGAYVPCYSGVLGMLPTRTRRPSGLVHSRLVLATGIAFLAVRISCAPFQPWFNHRSARETREHEARVGGNGDLRGS